MQKDEFTELNKILNDHFEQHKPDTLRELLTEWYYTHDAVQSGPIIVSQIVNIVRNWLPEEHDTNMYHSNLMIRRIRDKIG